MANLIKHCLTDDIERGNILSLCRLYMRYRESDEQTNRQWANEFSFINELKSVVQTSGLSFPQQLQSQRRQEGPGVTKCGPAYLLRLPFPVVLLCSLHVATAAWREEPVC